MTSSTRVIHLNGFPGTGKLTIARKLAERSNVRVIDNHASANLIFALVRRNGTTPIPQDAWTAISQIRQIVTDALPALALPELNFVFTHCLANECQDDRAVYHSVKSMAAKRGSRYSFINLTCAFEENRKRIVSPGREAGMKMTDPDGLKKMYGEYTLLTPDEDFFALDVTTLSPDEAAGKIWEMTNNTFNQPHIN